MYHIIFNPIAGKKNADKNLKAVEKVFSARGVEFDVHTSKQERDSQTIAKKLTANGATDLVVIGGDGTLHEVLNGMVDPTACRIGLIPSGTGNDFAEKIGLPMDAEKAALRILDGDALPTDYMEVGGLRCMNVGGLGMDVDVLERCKRGKMKGKMKYLISLLQSLFAFKGYRIEMESEGRKESHSALIAAVCNGAQFGGGIPICPTAEIDDGKINVILVDCIGGVWKIIKAFLQLMKGNILTYPATTHFLCDKVRFVPEYPCTVQLDGELYKGIDFDVKICTGLRFYR
ncbi:MAG: YegS/Rv2252/BmrU family lipid kinase [Clostridia bacterium]|nr:YegS/Rv2252/BmrU family lipid kinase [Clostridia bacterium]